MAVDASRLKRRRGLGSPPTEGAPGIEEKVALAPQTEKPRSRLATRDHTTADATGRVVADPQPASSPEQTAPAELDGLYETVLAAEPELPDEEPEIKTALSTVRGRRGGEVTAARHQRVPPPDAEPRMPFTTRVTLRAHPGISESSIIRSGCFWISVA